VGEYLGEVGDAGEKLGDVGLYDGLVGLLPCIIGDVGENDGLDGLNAGEAALNPAPPIIGDEGEYWGELGE